MTGKKRSFGSRSRSRSVSPDKTRHRKSSKGSSEQNDLSKRVKHKQSNSSDIPTSGRSNTCSKSKKISKSRHSSRSSDTSTDSQSDSSCSSKNSSLSKAKERKKLKKLERKNRKEKKLKKKHKKERRRHKKATDAVTIKKERALNVKPEVPRDEEPGEPIDQLLMDRAKAMAPMTKEEWEKRQSVIRRVYDEETGRHRLIKGDGEVLEEIVSRDRHREINRRATQGDGAFFQATIAAKLHK